MKYYKLLLSLSFLFILISCGGRNEPEEKNKKENNLSETSKLIKDSTIEENLAFNSETNSTIENPSTSSSSSKTPRKSNQTSFNEQKDKIILTPEEKKVEAVINSPLRNLLKNAQAGESYSKKELIEQYKFPKEAVDLIKQVTCIGPNKFYFKWGSIWFVEKVSDAKFKNDTLIFTFKQNKTYVSGGAIGIKYNKKIYTELILNNGAAYIPTVKGYHWDINK